MALLFPGRATDNVCIVQRTGWRSFWICHVTLSEAPYGHANSLRKIIISFIFTMVFHYWMKVYIYIYIYLVDASLSWWRDWVNMYMPLFKGRIPWLRVKEVCWGLDLEFRYLNMAKNKAIKKLLLGKLYMLSFKCEISQLRTRFVILKLLCSCLVCFV